MFKQLCFLKKRPDISTQEFMDYHESQWLLVDASAGQLASGVQHCIRRYLTPLKNPSTGEVIDPSYDCIIGIWRDRRESAENNMGARIIGGPYCEAPENAKQALATDRYPVCAAVERVSPTDRDGGQYDWLIMVDHLSTTH